MKQWRHKSSPLFSQKFATFVLHAFSENIIFPLPNGLFGELFVLA